MTDTEILECGQSIYDFLLDDTDIQTNMPFMEMPSFKKMNDVLSKNNTDMVPFTEFLNSKYNIYPKPLWWNFSARQFFSTTKALDFYKTILRDLKLKSCLS